MRIEVRTASSYAPLYIQYRMYYYHSYFTGTATPAWFFSASDRDTVQATVFPSCIAHVGTDHSHESCVSMNTTSTTTTHDTL